MSSKEYDDKMVESYIGSAMEKLQGAAKTMWEEGKFNGPEVHGKFKRPSPLLYSRGTMQYLVNILPCAKNLLGEVDCEIREAEADLFYNMSTMDPEVVEQMKTVIKKLVAIKSTLSDAILTTSGEDRYVFTVRCDWEIGHEGMAFRSSEEIYRWLMNNKALKGCYMDGLLCRQSIDDLMEGGILEIYSFQVPRGA